MSNQQPQRQDSLLDQLADVADEADRIGCRDAADWIRRTVRMRRRITPEMRRAAHEFMRDEARLSHDDL